MRSEKLLAPVLSSRVWAKIFGSHALSFALSGALFCANFQDFSHFWTFFHLLKKSTSKKKKKRNWIQRNYHSLEYMNFIHWFYEIARFERKNESQFALGVSTFWMRSRSFLNFWASIPLLTSASSTHSLSDKLSFCSLKLLRQYCGIENHTN